MWKNVEGGVSEEGGRTAGARRYAKCLRRGFVAEAACVREIEEILGKLRKSLSCNFENA